MQTYILYLLFFHSVIGDVSDLFLNGTEAVQQQLQEYEMQIFGPTESALSFPFFSAQSLSFGYGKSENNQSPQPVFGSFYSDSPLFSRAAVNNLPNEFVFGAAQTQNLSGNDIAMDSS